MSEIKVKENLNEMVKGMGFKRVKSRYGERFPYLVTLFNDVQVEFKDDANIRKLFQSYVDMGEEDFYKSKALVREIKQDDEGQIESEYICVKYELKDGSEIRLFTPHFNDTIILDNYCNLFKKLKKADKPKQ